MTSNPNLLFTFEVGRELFDIAVYDFGIDDLDPFLVEYATQDFRDAMRHMAKTGKAPSVWVEGRDLFWDFSEELTYRMEDILSEGKTGIFGWFAYGNIFTAQELAELGEEKND